MKRALLLANIAGELSISIKNCPNKDFFYIIKQNKIALSWLIFKLKNLFKKFVIIIEFFINFIFFYIQIACLKSKIKLYLNHELLLIVFKATIRRSL